MFYFITSQLSTNNPTSLFHSEQFTIPINTYSSPCLFTRTHDLALHPPLQHLLFSLLPHLIKNAHLKTPSTPCFRKLLINLTSKMKNWNLPMNTLQTTMLKLTRNPKNNYSLCNSKLHSFDPNRVKLTRYHQLMKTAERIRATTKKLASTLTQQEKKMKCISG